MEIQNIRIVILLFLCSEFFGCDSDKASRFVKSFLKDRQLDTWLKRYFQAKPKTRKKFVRRLQKFERMYKKGQLDGEFKIFHGWVKKIESGKKVSAEKTGRKRCIAMTGIGRACKNYAVGESKYCGIHIGKNMN